MMRISATILILGWLSTHLLPAQSTPARRSAPQSASGNEVRPPEVFARVQHLQHQLELIRQHLQAPKPSGPPVLQVVEAAPREVYFQALTLLRKADRMAFEQVRRRYGTFEHAPSGELTPSDVLQVVEAICARLQEIIEHLGIDPDSTSPPLIDGSKKPTEVFHAIVDANRQLNLMLKEQFSAGDVYQQVTLAVGYGARLLSLYPQADRIPPPPELPANLEAGDVFRQLVECFSLVRRTAVHWELDTLELSDRLNPVQAEPSDVYDLASVLVSELAYLYSRHPQLKPPRAVHDLGEKTPSELYQRSGVLLEQLKQLNQLTAPSPAAAEGGS